MKARSWLGFILVSVAVSNLYGQALHLDVRSDEPGLKLSWPGSLLLPSGRTVYPIYQVEQTADWLQWQPSGPLVKGQGGNNPMTRFISPSESRSFFRVRAQWEPATGSAIGDGGAQVLGYDAAFDAELQRIGQISTAEFQSRYGVTNEYLQTFGWDPTTATYWDRFNIDPAVNNEGLSRTNKGYRYYDFRLNDAELDLLRRNGFVVSERRASLTFAESFYRLWNDDMPVFVSTDAMLQAWHRSYDNMLIELEHFWLNKLVGDMLEGMAAQIPAAQQEVGSGPLRDSLLDADYFLTVARSLHTGSGLASAFGQEGRVRETMDAINAEELDCITLFDNPRLVDFSQFKIRGHYENSEELRRYFKTVMWLGRTDLRVAGNDQGCDGRPLSPSQRQLGTAIVLTRLLALANQFENWRHFDRVIRTFVGITDSMTFAQLADLMTAAGIRTLADIPSQQTLADLQTEIERGTLGVQNIRGDAFIAPLGPDQLRLPRSFTVFGQKFVLDSWAFSQVVFDEILWSGGEVLRRVPSCLDIAFGVLANNHVVPDLVERINNTSAVTSTNHSVRWRDGKPYQHNLAALRNVIDNQADSVWEENIYMHWLGALRQLSGSTTDAMYPQAMRTRAWAMKTLNTQMASWTQLRHDTILYAKPSYTPPWLCEYPDGFVEPQVGFWRRLEAMATRTANMIRDLPMDGVVRMSELESYDLAAIRTNQVRFLTNFAGKTAALREIAEQELRQEPLSAAQLRFIDSLMQVGYTNYFAGRVYGGWYPSLYYQRTFRIGGNADAELAYPLNFGSTKYDALAADVHTDLPDSWAGDPGGILHQGVGKVHLLYIAVESGNRRTIYAGPILSHYEWETPFSIRKTDSEWKVDLDTDERPPHPTWTQSFLVPSQ
jgi:hypothetical protein